MISTSPPILLACNFKTNPSGYCGASKSICHIGTNKEPINNPAMINKKIFETKASFVVSIQ